MNPALVKILRLSNSDDFVASVPEQERSPAVAERVFSEATGVPATTITKNIWATPALPEVVAGWLERYEPDLVFFKLNGFWVTYESVPVKLIRRLKFIGKPLGRASLAATPMMADYRGFQFIQRAALKTIGGESHFTPEEVVLRVSECIRRVLAKESVVLSVCGPLWQLAVYTSGARTRAAAGFAQVDGEIRQLCDRLGVGYLPLVEVPGAVAQLEDYLPDRIHLKPHMYRIIGEAEGRAMADAWLAASQPPSGDRRLTRAEGPSDAAAKSDRPPRR